MVEELFIRYSEDLKENKMLNKIYETLKNKGINPLIITSKYFTKAKIHYVTYIFTEKDFPKLSVIEQILNEANLLEKVEMINDF